VNWIMSGMAPTVMLASALRLPAHKASIHSIRISMHRLKACAVIACSSVF
jgi:hypothetical protein